MNTKTLAEQILDARHVITAMQHVVETSEQRTAEINEEIDKLIAQREFIANAAAKAPAILERNQAVLAQLTMSDARNRATGHIPVKSKKQLELKIERYRKLCAKLKELEANEV